jgi:hypothetical protein
MKSNKFFIVGLLAIAAIVLAGCGEKPQANVSVWVSDQSTGMPIEGVYVKAYSNYSFPIATDRWAAVNGTIEGTAMTNSNGLAQFELPPGSYVFLGTKDKYYPSGQEKILKVGNNSVYISMKRKPTNDSNISNPDLNNIKIPINPSVPNPKISVSVSGGKSYNLIPI